MQIPGILPHQMQSLRPTKRKIVRSIYTAEKVTRDIQKDLPEPTRGVASTVSELCNKTRNYITKS